MQNDTTTTVHVALDVHKDSIVAAYSVGLGEVQNLGNVGVLERDAPLRQSGGRPISLSARLVATEKMPTVPSPRRSSVI